MDTIKLDRVQTFSREDQRGNSPSRSLTRNDPMKGVIETRSQQSQSVIAINSLQKASKSYTGLKYTRLREHIVEPFNVPSTVVPIYANAPEVELYEKTFERPKYTFEKLTMSEVLSPFHKPRKNIDQRYILAKMGYLRHFFQRIQSAGVNYDVAVLCSDETSEAMLKTCFDTFCHVPISYFAPGAGVYGIIFKFRKQVPQPVASRSVDLMIAYDSACNIHHPEAFAFFTGTHRSRPWLINLCIADSADIRMYNFNLCNPNHPIHWNTRVADLPSQIANKVLYQPNRFTAITTVSGWVDYITRQLINWVIKKDYSEYTFTFPTKGFLHKFVLEFKYGHPPINPRPSYPSLAPYMPSKNKAIKETPSSSSRPDLNLVGYASSSSAGTSTLATKRKHDSTTEARKQPKTISQSYVNRFLPDLRAEPRKPRPDGPQDLASPTPAVAPRELDRNDIPLDAPPADPASMMVNNQERDADSSVPGQIVTPFSSTTTTASNTSVLPADATATAPTKNTVDFSRIDDIFAEALAQFEKDLDAIKVKL